MAMSDMCNYNVMKWVLVIVLVLLALVVLWWAFSCPSDCKTMGCNSSKCCHRKNNRTCFSGSGNNCPPATCDSKCTCEPVTTASCGCGSYYCKHRKNNRMSLSSSGNDGCPPVTCYTACTCA